VDVLDLLHPGDARRGGSGISLSMRDITWIVGTGRWEAVCSYEFERRGGPAGGDATARGHATDVLKVIYGNWQLVYRHESLL
jgi:hypothetical protein